ncbi:thiamine pyrophosphate-binding protein, partial [Aeromicrobium alkaliterrae]|uniref:thiamine pyrophosphate-binding protein n=1 Tax=Aeromicrobium alkaliterrae TaxID=302168 RepID=UPI0031D5706B
MTAVHGADRLAQVLQEHGVESVFTLCGNHTLRIYQALHDVGIRLVDCRNEAVAAMAADAAARLSRRPAVALVTGGPGLTNALTGLVTAHGADSPLILLSGQNATALDGMGAQQELDQAAAASALCKWSAVVTEGDQLVPMLRHAFATAMSGTTGAVHVALPSDVMTSEGGKEGFWVAPELPESVVRTEDVAHVAELIRAAERPIVIAGAGAFMAGADISLQTLVEQCNIPLFTLDTARGLVPDDHRCVLGYGDPSFNPAAAHMGDADCVVLIGRRLDFRLRFGDDSVIHPEATLIDIHNAGAVVDGNRRRELVATDIDGFLTNLAADLADYRADDAWLDRLQSDNPLRRPETERHVPSSDTPEGLLHPASVVDALRDAIPP